MPRKNKAKKNSKSKVVRVSVGKKKRKGRAQSLVLEGNLKTPFGSLNGKYRSGKVASISSNTVPVATASTLTPNFSIRNGRFKDSIIVIGQERLGSIEVSNSAAPGNQIISIDVNPMNIGARLPQFAVLYRKYMFSSIVFKYVPTATAFTTGANQELMMAVDYDPTSSDIDPGDLLPPDELYAWEGTVAGSAIYPFNMALKRMDPSSEFYVTDDGGDNRLVTQARLYVVNSTTSTADATLGNLYCTYAVELFIPHIALPGTVGSPIGPYIAMSAAGSACSVSNSSGWGSYAWQWMDAMGPPSDPPLILLNSPVCELGNGYNDVTEWSSLRIAQPGFYQITYSLAIDSPHPSFAHATVSPEWAGFVGSCSMGGASGFLEGCCGLAVAYQEVDSEDPVISPLSRNVPFAFETNTTIRNTFVGASDYITGVAESDNHVAMNLYGYSATFVVQTKKPDQYLGLSFLCSTSWVASTGTLPPNEPLQGTSRLTVLPLPASSLMAKVRKAARRPKAIEYFLGRVPRPIDSVDDAATDCSFELADELDHRRVMPVSKRALHHDYATSTIASSSKLRHDRDLIVKAAARAAGVPMRKVERARGYPLGNRDDDYRDSVSKRFQERLVQAPSGAKTVGALIAEGVIEPSWELLQQLDKSQFVTIAQRPAAVPAPGTMAKGEEKELDWLRFHLILNDCVQITDQDKTAMSGTQLRWLDTGVYGPKRDH
jgi:hypothetical protein